jgi:hypothetical protein
MRRLLCFMKFHRYDLTQTFTVGFVKYEVFKCACGAQKLGRSEV